MSEQIERGSYEIIRDRLLEQARQLGGKAERLNAQRLKLFGGAEMAVEGNERIRTENNCIPRDIVAVGNRLLFGYNVFIGLRTETRLQDVFSLHSFERKDKGFAFEQIAVGEEGHFLADPRFAEEFQELYRYYKDSRLLQLRNLGTKLLAVFQFGKTAQDLRVFRWALDPQGKAAYIDNRGERDHAFPASHDFEWTPTGREDFVLGRHPHVNILNEVFVDTVGGDLTVKVEDNTEDGRGIYREPVEEADQSLDDAQVHFAKVGILILLKVLPFREEGWRYLVYNTRTQKVDRIDAIGQACLQLPEDHGIIFPGGYYLQDGEIKVFDRQIESMEFKRSIKAPNGEDVLYVFHRRDEGLSILLTYNLIRKEVDNPIYCHGYGRFPDGTMIVFRAASEEPTRVHPMQIWKTPFCSDEHQAQAPSTGSYLEKVGNADLVRGISDCLSLRRAILEQAPSRQVYEDLIAAATRSLDSYYWLDHDEAGDLHSTLTEIRSTSELIIDEFEKVETVRRQAVEAVAESEGQLADLLRGLRPESWTAIDEFVDALTSLRRQRGHLITLREMRYVDLERLDEMEAQLVERFDQVSGQAVQFLQDETAFEPYRQQIEALAGRCEQIEKVTESTQLGESLQAIGDGLDLLTEVVGALKIEDATLRTQILEQISELLGALNRARALLQNRRKELLSSEGVAEFAAQFKVFGQNVTGSMALADTPEKCEEQLSRLMLQLEELESRFSEFEQFLEQLTEKREDVYEAFTSKKQRLLDERQRRAQHVMQACERILQGIQRRVRGLGGEDELNAFFAADPMAAKLRELSGKLRQLEDSVRADEVDSRLKTARQDAGRAMRDRLEIYEEGEKVIKLGKHRFSVNTQPLDLTMVPRDSRMYFHLAGTGFFELVGDPEFQQTRPFWDQHLLSESSEVYRCEYLAACLLAEAEEEKGGLSLEKLRQAALEEKTLLELVRKQASERYEEGYERGIHDADAARILRRVLELYNSAGLLRFAPLPRAMAALFWAYSKEGGKDDGRASGGALERRARSLSRLRSSFAHSPAIAALTQELGGRIGEFSESHGIVIDPQDAHMAGSYLFEELAQRPVRFAMSNEARGLLKAFSAHLKETGSWRDFEEDLKALQDDLSNRYQLASA
ncbi:MAG: DNA repair ATPase, partial [Acidobacteriota bacterium]